MRYLLLFVFLFSIPPELQAHGKTKLAKESIEFAARRIGAKSTPRFGKHALKKATIRRAAVATGDDAAAAVAIAKHTNLAKPLVRQYGQTATKAFANLSNRNARRLAMLANDGPTPNKELLNVIARHGDAAMEFIWKNKGPLLTAAALAAFLANPEPFINGATDLSADVAERALQPVATGVAARTNWTLIFLTVVGLLITRSVLRHYS